MFCKWCGMESATTDQCSWCHRSFGTSAEAAPETEDTRPVEQAVAPAEIVETPPPLLVVPVEAAPQPAETVPVAAPQVEPPADEPDIIPLRRATRKVDVQRPAPAAPPPARNKTSRLSPTTPMPPAPARTTTTRLTPQTPAASTQPPATPGASATPAPITPMQKTAAPTTRLALPESLTRRLDQVTLPATDEVDDTPGLAQGVAVPPSAAELHVPQMGTFRAEKSKYYQDQVVDPASGTHYDALTGAPIATPTSGGQRQTTAAKIEEDEDEVEVEGPSLATLVFRWVAAFAALLALMAGAAHQWPQFSVGAMCITVFLAALLMPVMRAAPWQDDDSDDVVVFIILTIVFGPIISILIYVVLCVIRQDFAPAIAGLFLIGAAARLVDEAATGTLATMRLLPWQGHFDAHNVGIAWIGLLGIVGWYSANVFHKLDE